MLPGTAYLSPFLFFFFSFSRGMASCSREQRVNIKGGGGRGLNCERRIGRNNWNSASVPQRLLRGKLFTRGTKYKKSTRQNSRRKLCKAGFNWIRRGQGRDGGLAKPPHSWLKHIVSINRFNSVHVFHTSRITRSSLSRFTFFFLFGRTFGNQQQPFALSIARGQTSSISRISKRKGGVV